VTDREVNVNFHLNNDDQASQQTVNAIDAINARFVALRDQLDSVRQLEAQNQQTF